MLVNDLFITWNRRYFRNSFNSLHYFPNSAVGRQKQLMDPTDFESACFTTFAIVAGITFFFAVRYTLKYNTYVAFILPVSFFIAQNMLDLIPPNIVICMPFYHVWQHHHGSRERESWELCVWCYVCTPWWVVYLSWVYHFLDIHTFPACIIPMILITCYEVAYLVHKRRSVNFCGITFEVRQHFSELLLSYSQPYLVWPPSQAERTFVNLFAVFHLGGGHSIVCG